MGKKARTGIKSRKFARLAPEKRYRVAVEVKRGETLHHFARFNLDYCCVPQPKEGRAGKRPLHAFADGSVINSLRSAGRKVKVLADAEREGKRLQRNVGKGDRFRGGRRGPQGVGQLV